MSYNPGNPFPPMNDRNERTLRATPTNQQWLLVSDDQPWAKDGACVGEDPDLMFPTDAAEVVNARKLCGGCPVREACLATAMADPTLLGVWGGTTEAHRNRERLRARKRATYDRNVSAKLAEARAALKN